MGERAVGRPRDHRLDDAIAKAALDVMFERGYHGASFAGIARRAGVGTPALYRRWPNKAALAMDMIERQAEPWPLPDTGSIRRDLAAFVRHRIRMVTTPLFKQVLFPLSLDATSDPKLAEEVMRRFAAYREPALEPRIRKAMAAGELRRDVDPLRLIDMLVGPLMMPLIFASPPPREREAMAIVDLALDGFGRRRTQRGR